MAVGLVETHGRTDTARLVHGLEVIPRKKQEYRGIVLEEMDVDAVLTRKPQIALVDELAHTNIPGSRNAKRYEDVQELLDAGIHVISTLNIQHLESLYNIVEQATGIKVRERIPDSVIAEADQLVNVDLTYEDLQERLSEGKIYPKDRIETALRNFFKKTNLDQLRELTLRRWPRSSTRRYRTPFREEIASMPDQVMVCLSSKGPNTEKLLRYGSRLAGRLNRNWYAVYVQTPPEEPTSIDSRTQRLIARYPDPRQAARRHCLCLQGRGYRQDDPSNSRRNTGSVTSLSADRARFRSGSAFRQEEHRGRADLQRQGDQRGRARYGPARGSTRRKTSRARRVGKGRGAARFTQGGRSGPSRILSAEDVIIWEKPVSQQDALRQLSALDLEKSGNPEPRQDPERRPGTGKTGLDVSQRGNRLPHARMEDLQRSYVALGIPRQGIADVSTESPIECVFLILSPTRIPTR